jgi:hypothetical protein
MASAGAGGFAPLLRTQETRMSHPTWMLYLDNDAVASERLEQACRLARRFESHLVGLSCHRPQAWPDIGPAAMLGSDPLTVELQDRLRGVP